MFHPLVILVASLPLLFRLIPMFVPPAYLESYNYWSADALNRREGSEEGSRGRMTKWRNMGYWENTTSYPDAAHALAQKLIDLADAPAGGSVLDIAHGSGESLLLHLLSIPPPSTLHGLTSLPRESADAQHLIDITFAQHPELKDQTRVELFVGSASFRPGKDVGHVLDPMRGYLGRSGNSPSDHDSDDPDHENGEEEQPLNTDPEVQSPFSSDVGADAEASLKPKGYNLIYILDAIYHFPPSVPYILHTIQGALSPGGVLAYTDILPPPNGPGNLWGHLILPWLTGVPTRNIMSRPKDLKAYEEMLTGLGYVDVLVQDWTEGVFPGFERDLRGRGGAWGIVGRGVGWAERGGWRFIGVRARRPMGEGDAGQSLSGDGAEGRGGGEE